MSTRLSHPDPETTEAANSHGSATPTQALRFPAFRHPDFRLFWAGNLVSLVGTWAQQTAQGWLVRSLTPDPLLLAVVASCGSIPVLLLTLHAGAVADRVDKRRTLLLTNSLAMILAAVLGMLVWFNIVQVWHIALVALGLGAVNAFDIPARQSFNVEMVGREDLPNAIALNSSAFNAARVFGPAAGGILLQRLGVAGCFFANALSFGALLWSLSKMSASTRLASEVAPRQASTSRAGRHEILEGFHFVRSHAVLWPVVLLVAWVSVFAMSFGTLLPAFAKDVFKTDERGFSLLMTCNGLGALVSAATLAAGGTMRHKGKRLMLGAALFSFSVGLFAFSPTLLWGCVALILAGWFLLTFLTTANTLVQTLAPDELRGRVFSLYSLALIGTSPVGALLIGSFAKIGGIREGVGVGATLSALFCIGLFWRCRSLWKEK